DRLRDFLLFRFLRVELGALPLYLLPVAGRHRQGQLARQQVIARVTVGDLHDLAAIPEVLDVRSQYHFHGGSSKQFTGDSSQLTVSRPFAVQRTVNISDRLWPSTVNRRLSGSELLRHIRYERNLTRALDRRLELALVHGTGARNAARQDLAALRD